MFAPLLLTTALAFTPQEPVDQKAIDGAIDRGVAFLLSLYEKDKRGPGRGKARKMDLERSGLRALILYTMLKSGVEQDHVVIDRLLGELSFDKIDQTYDAACILLALVTHDPVAHRPWIEELAWRLIDWQDGGDWGYPDGEDLSNTQYAALGLWAAARAGVDVPTVVWRELAMQTLLYQDETGGFSYTQPGKGGSGSMTAAGVGTVALCEMHLALAGDLKPDEAARFGAARSAGLAWLDEFFSVETNPRSGAWLYYYLYGLERTGALSGADLIGEHDWYAEGAEFLVRKQDEKGSWEKGSDFSQTCFALLFLRRATSGEHKPKGPLTQGGREREGDEAKNATNDPAAVVQIEIEDQAPLRIWITGFGRAATKALEWPGETGLGPHVSRVEYLADGEPIAVVIGDPAHPAAGSRFWGTHVFDKTGTFELVARVHVLGPPSRSAKGEEIRGQETVIESPPLEVEITEALPEWTSELARQRGANRLAVAKASAKGSSKLRKTDGLPERKYTAELAIDGNPRTPWLAGPKDDEPTLRISLKKAQEADTVLVALAHLVPHPADVIAQPTQVEVRVNKKDVHLVDTGPDPARKLTVELAKAVKVKSLEIRLIGRPDGRDRTVGIGEVVLLHRADVEVR